MQKYNVMLTPFMLGNDTLNGGGLLYGGEGDDDRMRWRFIVANDETTHVWRVAA